MPELKQCPFCGMPATVKQDAIGSWYLECSLCGVFKGYYRTKQFAIDAWNTRSKNSSSTWTSTDTRLPVEEWKQHKESTGEKTTEFIVMIKGAEHPTALYFDGTRWLDESGYNYPVQYWMNMPEIPMEEDNYES